MLKFGRYQGKSLESVFLSHPDYISWLLSQEASNPRFEDVQNEARELIEIFDAKPYVYTCNGKQEDCPNFATRASGYWDSPSLMWWCDDCDPTKSGADRGKVRVIIGFQDAVQHAALNSRYRSVLKILIRDMANAKGLPMRMGPNDAAAFFTRFPAVIRV